VVEDILEAIQSISDEARRALADPEMSRETLLSALSVSTVDPRQTPRSYPHRTQALIDENHAYLVNLGVSHPSLEAIKNKTASTQYGLHTKLTGAGGGGCAVTLIPDGTQYPALSWNNSKSDTLPQISKRPYYKTSLRI